MSFDRFAHEAKAPPLSGDVKAAFEYHRLAALEMDQEARKTRDEWKQRDLNRLVSAPKDFEELWLDVTRPPIDLAPLPTGSWFLQLSFRLRTPYLSRDEELYHVIDNPVRSEPLWGLPFVAPTSWKGLLRETVRSSNGLPDDDKVVRRLFGNLRAAERDFQQGRLRFFPTFFERKGLEIINPHDRKRRVGRNPILIECVPARAEGIFTLLYVPFDSAGKEPDVKTSLDDLDTVASGLQALFTESGFSAKTSSGYGLAEERLVGDTNVLELRLGPKNTLQETAKTFNDVPSAAQRLREQVREARGGGS